MKFLVDAQLPLELSDWLNKNNFDSIHTLDLPNKNFTTYDDICKISIQENRIVITKDTDFLLSFKLYKKPYKLLLITTGNISNEKLKEIFTTKLEELIFVLKENSFIELTSDSLIIHQ
ncbi:MAG: DUF5615 family PIN-like protein [Bacteroidota bacterium]